jgi:hypothetical protein
MNYQDLYSIEGLQFVPVNEQKRPLLKDWQTSLEKHDLTKCYGVGLVCGSPSGGVECVDVDCKYDITGKLFDNYKARIHAADQTLLKLLVVQKTKSGGYHLIYRCSVNSGNTKLANRYTTEEEKSATYEAAYLVEVNKGTEDSIAKKVAQKARDNDKVRVLLETRSQGGQFVIHPTPGYEFIYGDLCSISEITPEQREVLYTVAMSFSEVVEEIKVPTRTNIHKTIGLSVFDDYNQRGDVLGLLQNNGWKIVSQKGSKTHLLRPGQTTAATSGNFDHEKNWFSVFTTSTEFEPQHAYLPYAVYAVLECGKDFSLASKKLFELGYGERAETKKEAPKPSTRIIPSRVNVELKDKSLFATPADYDGYLQQVIDGTLQMGLTTGFPTLDEYFVWKEGNLVMVNGIDNVGKSEIVWYLFLLCAMYHGWRFIIFSSENSLGAFMRRMIQLYWGKPLHGHFAMNRDEYIIAKKFIEDHFTLIKAQEDLYNYKDIINLVKIARSEGDYKFGLIDPYNSLKIDLSGYSKLNTHEYHYEAISEIKSYGQQNNFGWAVTHHAVTAALRMRDSEKKYPVAPRKEDTEGGGKVPNKADDFITAHRLTQHPTEWMITELHVRKIKDTDTGGKPTPIDQPVKFERYKGGYAYCEWLEGGQRGIDPVSEWHERMGTSKTKIISATQLWTPYKDDSTPEPMNDITF